MYLKHKYCTIYTLKYKITYQFVVKWNKGLENLGDW